MTQSSTAKRPLSKEDACFEAMVKHAERQRLARRGARFEPEHRAVEQSPDLVTGGGNTGNPTSRVPGSDDGQNPDLAWGSAECAVEVHGADTQKNRKRVYNWRAKVRAGLRTDSNYPNPGFVFFDDTNAVVLSRRAFRSYTARKTLGRRS